MEQTSRRPSSSSRKTNHTVPSSDAIPGPNLGTPSSGSSPSWTARMLRSVGLTDTPTSYGELAQARISARQNWPPTHAIPDPPTRREKLMSAVSHVSATVGQAGVSAAVIMGTVVAGMVYQAFGPRLEEYQRRAGRLRVQRMLERGYTWIKEEIGEGWVKVGEGEEDSDEDDDETTCDAEEMIEEATVGEETKPEEDRLQDVDLALTTEEVRGHAWEIVRDEEVTE